MVARRKKKKKKLLKAQSVISLGEKGKMANVGFLNGRGLWPNIKGTFRTLISEFLGGQKVRCDVTLKESENSLTDNHTETSDIRTHLGGQQKWKLDVLHFNKLNFRLLVIAGLY